MSSLGNFQAGLISWVRKYASNEYPVNLLDGTVVWFNRDRPFISDTTDAGLYCRLSSFTTPGRAGRTRATVSRTVVTHHPGGPDTTVTTPYVVTTYHSNDKVRFSVQAVSLVDTDEDSALVWLNNLAGRCWTDESLADLLVLNCSIVKRGDITLSAAPLDDRSPTVGTFDLVLHLHSDVVGLDTPYVQSVEGTVTATHGAVTIPPQTFEVSE
jgi:hypothetical protein